MKNKLKLTPTMVCALIGIGSFSIANATDAWSTANLKSYVAGSQVTDGGKTYKCKVWPASGWCQIAAYKPSGTYGSDAWDVIGDDPSPTPTPEPTPEPTPTPDPVNPGDSVQQWDANTVYNPSDKSKPSQAIYNGNLYTAKWWTRGENPSQSGQWGVWKNEGPVTEQGKATVSIVLPAKPDFIANDKLADVQILKDGQKIAESTNAKWGSTTNLEVVVGDSADLTVSVPAIDGATGSATPASFTLAKDASKTVNIEYTAPKPAEEGSIKINATAEAMGNPTATYTLKDTNGNIVSSGNLAINSSTTLDHIPSSENGTAYTLTIGSFTTNGYNYTPVKTYSLVVTNFNTTAVDVTFAKKQVPTESISIAVEGLPKDKTTTLTLTSENGDTKEVDIKSNSSISVEVPKDGSIWNIAVAAIAGFKLSVTPTSFTANQDTQQISLKITENSSSADNWPDRVVVGYVRGYDAPWYSQPETTNEMIQAAMTHGYNVIVYAFAGQEPNGTVTLPKWTDSMKSRVPSQINIIHNSNGIALLSIGGAVNYFDPDMSGDKAIPTGKAMGKYLAENGYDGLDIDVEHPNASTSVAANFIKYIDAARAEFKSITGKDMYLAAAPQVNGWYGTGQWASGSAKFAEAMYTQDFMRDAHFNAVFIQTYNQYGGANFGGLLGFDVGFLTKTFELLSPQTRDKMPGIPAGSFYVPEDTKIVLGVPDFKDPSVSAAEYKQGSCLATAKCSGAGLYDPVDISKDITNGGLGNYSQYGGLMTWILNSDDYQGWTWVDGVKGVAYN
ncbi:carbohydrate binding domain protein [Francisella philomiragia subsp. philomiragia ATCC 25015]|uniref:glycosyl hydrolase family 18 protein n=1 Tax=Francisella philomiragia TaxID=28110 RepID=UPI0001AF7723|nr:glycosyl hydrolase family 18 protein [Francisella philomiragia]AJI75524.1 carbohydrate binding domain protein [Francisella philomiragia subsp. philomiragia ATCC 25015]EET21826.1 predicted protein [Francisella philomiragia subsp. philomiragia ATCC 25015]MBK2238996.1 hypothetical protein [Francisella philomiragia]